ncbi:MAG: hypothetical protein J6W10_03110 [Kiritimatiellae bacterium]|nr:hypothetical protein [Kiritimatiellia bacterium]
MKNTNTNKTQNSKSITITIRETVRRYQSWKSDERVFVGETERVYTAKLRRKTLVKYGVKIALSEAKAMKGGI